MQESDVFSAQSFENHFEILKRYYIIFCFLQDQDMFDEDWQRDIDIPEMSDDPYFEAYGDADFNVAYYCYGNKPTLSASEISSASSSVSGISSASSSVSGISSESSSATGVSSGSSASSGANFIHNTGRMWNR